MKKIYTIETTVYPGDISGSREVCALYEAAGKVFEIPPFDVVVEAVVEGNYAPMQECVENVRDWYIDKPHTGPTVYRDIYDDSLCIVTNGGRRIFITPDSICIDFRRNDEGSTIAAGEVIGHVWAGDPGDKLNGIMARMANKYVDINDYSGPVHPQLGRVAYDAEFRQKFEAGEINWFSGLEKRNENE